MNDQRYIETEADLIPLREHGAVYIVTHQYGKLLDNVDGFLTELGGSLARIPIPAGTPDGDKTVQECIKDFAIGLMKEHKQNIETFTTATRNDTLDREAERIKQTRLKLEAYMVYMGEMRDKLEDTIKQADLSLVATIRALQKDKKDLPQKEAGSGRDLIFDQPVTDTIRWMACEEWTKKEAVQVLETFGVVVSINTINAQFWRAENWKGKPGGDPGEFSKKEVAELEALRKKASKS